MKLLYIDLFCGAGGTSTGVENARHDGRQCAKVIGCVNHDANAIASHAANHPDALHFTEDIRTLELSPLTAHIAEMRRQYPDAFVVLWASLECTNFSKAKGGATGLFGRTQRWKPVREVLDFSDEGESIFGRRNRSSMRPSNASTRVSSSLLQAAKRHSW